MEADGSDVERLTETPDEEGSPSWSPDGTKLVYPRILDETDDYDLWVVNADGSCPTQLTDTRAWEQSPDLYGRSGAARTPLDC